MSLLCLRPLMALHFTQTKIQKVLNGPQNPIKSGLYTTLYNSQFVLGWFPFYSLWMPNKQAVFTMHNTDKWTSRMCVQLYYSSSSPTLFKFQLLQYINCE